MSIEFNNLQNEIIKFRDERDWKQFHKPKDLLIGMNIEIAELQELFLWKEPELVDRNELADEVADIFIFLTYISYEFDVDILQAVRSKLMKNSIKYPLDKSKGSNKKYTEL